MPPAQTKSSTRRLSDVARHVIVPDGIVTTGYPAVRDKCREIGIVHDDWQQALGRLVLGKRGDGKYAASVGGVVLSIPRQVGKTFFVGSLVFALCMLFPGLTVLWTAHHTRTSDETFGKLAGLARRRKCVPYIDTVRRANGQQTIEFRNGSRILFGAREQGFGRGFSEVDIEVFDEAQILTDRALEDMIAATNQARHPSGALLFYMGTPPRPVDPGESFTNKRAKALANKSKDMVFVEMSADPGANPDDRGQWAKANASYPKRTPDESMQRLRENVGSDESFIREGLGVWDEELAGVVSPVKWARLEDATATAGFVAAFAVEVTLDRRQSVIGLAGPKCSCVPPMAQCDSGGITHLELVEERAGTAWVIPVCVGLHERHPRAMFVIDGNGPAAALADDLEQAGVPVRVVKGELPIACTGLVDAVNQEQISHGPDPLLDAAVRAAKPRPRGDGNFTFGRSASGQNITPLYTVTLAHWAAVNEPTVNVLQTIW